MKNATWKTCPTFLSEEQIVQFEDNGFLAFSEVLNPQEVEQARAALSRIARELASDPASQYSPPKVSSKKSNMSGASYRKPESGCFMLLESGYNPVGQRSDEVELQVRKFMSFTAEDPVFGEMLAAGSRIRRVVDALIGASPILFQEMALVKPPFVGSEKPWHQDNAYFSVSPLNAVLGVWIALDDAGVENGCMHVIPGGHREGAAKHHHGTDCEIDPALLAVDRAVPVPIPAGGALFFYGMLPHETPPNRSPQRRRALQFHYRAATSHIVDEEAYDRLFVNREGVPASCRSASKLGF